MGLLRESQLLYAPVCFFGMPLLRRLARRWTSCSTAEVFTSKVLWWQLATSSMLKESKKPCKRKVHEISHIFLLNVWAHFLQRIREAPSTSNQPFSTTRSLPNDSFRPHLCKVRRGFSIDLGWALEAWTPVRDHCGVEELWPRHANFSKKRLEFELLDYGPTMYCSRSFWFMKTLCAQSLRLGTSWIETSEVLAILTSISTADPWPQFVKSLNQVTDPQTHPDTTRRPLCKLCNHPPKYWKQLVSGLDEHVHPPTSACKKDRTWCRVVDIFFTQQWNTNRRVAPTQTPTKLLTTTQQLWLEANMPPHVTTTGRLWNSWK